MKLDDKIKKNPKGIPSLGILSSLGDDDNKEYKMIDIYEIDFNEKNFHNMFDTEEGIIELAEDIEAMGLINDIVVTKQDNGRYKLISGERRTKAFRYLYEKTKDAKWRYIRGRVASEYEDVLNEEIAQILANDQRPESEIIEARKVIRLNDLYKEKKARGEKVGFIRKKIAETKGISETQVKRYLRVEKLIPEFQKKVHNNEMSFIAALNFVVFDESIQREIYNTLVENNIKLTVENAEKIRDEILAKENNNADVKDSDNEIRTFLRIPLSADTEFMQHIENKEHTQEEKEESSTSNNIIENNTVKDTVGKAAKRPPSIKKSLSSFIKIAEKVISSEDAKSNITSEEKDMLLKAKELVNKLITL